MRCIIAGYPFHLTANEVQQAMRGVAPEPVTGESVKIGRRTYPLMQVGAVITRQDRRDFSAGEVGRAMRKLGFTCLPAPAAELPDPFPAGTDAPLGAVPHPAPAPGTPDAARPAPAPSPFSDQT